MDDFGTQGGCTETGVNQVLFLGGKHYVVTDDVQPL